MKPQITAPSDANLTPDEQRKLQGWRATSNRFGKTREQRRDDTPAEVLEIQNRYEKDQ